MINYEEIKAKMDAYLESEECKEYFRKMRAWNKREKYHSERVHEFIKLNPIYLEKFLIWEEKYQERKYKQGVITNSRLFNMIFGIWSQYGKETNKDYKKDKYGFLGGSYKYLGYKMQVFIGQGSFHRVYKHKECIFQSN